MKIIMYGTEICPDCVEAKKRLVNYDYIDLDFRNITENTAILKEFLCYRDNDDIFASIIKGGKIGIPFFILEDGTKTFEFSDFISDKQCSSEQSKNSCSIDGSGCLS